MPPTWNAARTKVQIRLSIQRLRTLQEKKLALAKASRRDIADLLLKNRIETARLRVETLIQDDIYVELLEVMELYAETLQARFGLLDAATGETPESSISDAVCSVVYAAPRIEIKEMHVLREMLMQKYGRTFALSLQQSDPPPESVPKRVTSKLALFTPSKELVDAYLSEIAKGYGVAWLPEPSFSQDEVTAEEQDQGEDGKGAEGAGEANDADEKEVDEVAGGDKNKETSPPVKSKASTTGPNTNPTLAAPTPASAPAPAPTVPKEVNPPPAGPDKDAWAGTGDDDEELAKRFERLKKLR